MSPLRATAEYPAIAKLWLVDRLGYGLRLLFSSCQLSAIGGPDRQLCYLSDFKSLLPQRASGHSCLELPPATILHEPLCFNYKVVEHRGCPPFGTSCFGVGLGWHNYGGRRFLLHSCDMHFVSCCRISICHLACGPILALARPS